MQRKAHQCSSTHKTMANMCARSSLAHVNSMHTKYDVRRTAGHTHSSHRALANAIFNAAYTRLPIATNKRWAIAEKAQNRFTSNAHQQYVHTKTNDMYTVHSYSCHIMEKRARLTNPYRLEDAIRTIVLADEFLVAVIGIVFRCLFYSSTKWWKSSIVFLFYLFCFKVWLFFRCDKNRINKTFCRNKNRDAILRQRSHLIQSIRRTKSSVWSEIWR